MKTNEKDATRAFQIILKNATYPSQAKEKREKLGYHLPPKMVEKRCTRQKKNVQQSNLTEGE